MRVLLVCAGNTCRSPMAAAIWRQLYPSDEVFSAGLSAEWDRPMTPAAATALESLGYPSPTHRSQPLTPDLLLGADLILTMDHRQAAELRRRYHLAPGTRVATLGEAAGRPEVEVADPIGGTAADYRRTAELLATLIRRARNHTSSHE